MRIRLRDKLNGEYFNLKEARDSGHSIFLDSSGDNTPIFLTERDDYYTCVSPETGVFLLCDINDETLDFPLTVYNGVVELSNS